MRTGRRVIALVAVAGVLGAAAGPESKMLVKTCVICRLPFTVSNTRTTQSIWK